MGAFRLDREHLPLARVRKTAILLAKREKRASFSPGGSPLAVPR